MIERCRDCRDARINHDPDRPRVLVCPRCVEAAFRREVLPEPALEKRKAV